MSKYGIAVFTALLTMAAVLAAEPVKLAKPVGMVVEKTNRQKIGGFIQAYDDASFVIKDRAGTEHTVQWAELSPPKVFQVHEKIIDRKSAEAWYRLGKLMEARETPALVKRAMDRATKLDAGIAEKMAAREKAAQPDPTDPKAGGQTGGPRIVGNLQERYWGKLSEEDMKAAEEILREFARETEKKMNVRLQGFQTKYFIFCTDLPPDEARAWAKLLDRMYDMLCDMFAVKRGTNVWRGKCLVMAFTSADDYRRFQMTMHNTSPGGSAGMCHGFGDGMVHIAYYRHQDKNTLGNVLVHESVHGFLHRYRSHRHVPSWANEGLAEVIAEELVPQSRQVEYKEKSAVKTMRDTRSIGSTFFTARNIEFWQYGVASSLTKYMIQENRKGYVAFINGIKDGMPVDEALAEKYGAGKDRIINAFGNWHDIQGLRYK